MPTRVSRGVTQAVNCLAGSFCITVTQQVTYSHRGTSSRGFCRLETWSDVTACHAHACLSRTRDENVLTDCSQNTAPSAVITNYKTGSLKYTLYVGLLVPGLGRKCKNRCRVFIRMNSRSRVLIVAVDQACAQWRPIGSRPWSCWKISQQPWRHLLTDKTTASWKNIELFFLFILSRFYTWSIIVLRTPPLARS